MCDFCNKNNIITNEYYDSLHWSNRYELPMTFIMKDNILNQYHLFIQCDDDYYSGKYIEDIKYCPKCGRKIDD